MNLSNWNPKRGRGDRSDTPLSMANLTSALGEAIRGFVDDPFPSLLSAYKKLIQTHTPDRPNDDTNGENNNVKAYIREQYERLGLPTQIDPSIPNDIPTDSQARLALLESAGLVLGQDVYKRLGISLRVPPIPEGLIFTCFDQAAPCMLVFDNGMPLEQLASIAKGEGWKEWTMDTDPYNLWYLGDGNRSPTIFSESTKKKWFVAPVPNCGNKDGDVFAEWNLRSFDVRAFMIAVFLRYIATGEKFYPDQEISVGGVVFQSDSNGFGLSRGRRRK